MNLPQTIQDLCEMPIVSCLLVRWGSKNTEFYTTDVVKTNAVSLSILNSEHLFSM